MDNIIGILFRYLLREWAVLKQAPAAFLLTTVLGVGIGSALMYWHYAERIEVLNLRSSGCRPATANVARCQIGPEPRRKLEATLRSGGVDGPPYVQIVNCPSPDCEECAELFSDILHASGWEQPEPPGVPFGHLQPGIWIHSLPNDANATVLLKALNAAGIVAQIDLDPEWEKRPPQLEIGREVRTAP